MAFLKYSKMLSVQPFVPLQKWDNIRTAAKHKTSIPENLLTQASKIFKTDFDPTKYLLSHATIVASVDSQEVVGAKVGSVKEEGRKINRKYSNYQVTPETQKFFNNNNDGWDRPVLWKAYPTFIGGENFQEHVQVPELSKGKIIDAVARDIGESLYVDILVATDKSHVGLIRSIESGQLDTLSMGCFLPGTMVTLFDGTRIPIEEIMPGDMVWTHLGRPREVLNKQNRFWRGDVVSIKMVGVPTYLTATDNHPFVVYRPNEMCGCGCGEILVQGKDRARNLCRKYKRGHSFKSLESVSKKISSQKIAAKDLRMGDFLCFPKNSLGIMPVEGVSSGKARLLGYFLAEGSFFKSSGKHVGVEFSFSIGEKDTYAKEVLDLLKNEFNTAREPKLAVRTEKNGTRVWLYDKQVAAWFLEKAGEYSSRKKLHPSVLSWPVEIQKQLLGAWINGDGCLHKQHGSVIGTTISYDLACQVQAIAANCGMFTRMVSRLDGTTFSLQGRKGGRGVRSVDTNKSVLYDVWFGKIVSKELLGFSDKISLTRTHKQDSRVLDDVVLYPITDLKTSPYTGWVHNMEVEEDHSYIVEGVSAYNCTIEFSICTKCGNVGVDEPELCEHIRYEKGNRFYDSKGLAQIIAELCGYHDFNETGGVRFIEASWVANPAFTGAVLRNILEAKDVSPDMIKKAEAILRQPPAQWVDTGSRQITAKEFDFSELDNLEDSVDEADKEEEKTEEETEEGGEDKEKKEKAPFKDIEDGVYTKVVEKVKKKFEDELRKEEMGEELSPESSTSYNDTLIKQAREYRTNIYKMQKNAKSDADFVNKLAVYNDKHGVDLPMVVYRTALEIGPAHNLSKDQFLMKVSASLGRSPTKTEMTSLIRISRLLNFFEETKKTKE